MIEREAIVRGKKVTVMVRQLAPAEPTDAGAGVPASRIEAARAARFQLMELPPQAAKGVRRRGHAERPGTGPEGETCGSCEHVRKRFTGAGRAFHKCELRRASWTAGGGSDVRLKDPACGAWEKKESRS